MTFYLYVLSFLVISYSLSFLFLFIEPHVILFITVFSPLSTAITLILTILLIIVSLSIFYTIYLLSKSYHIKYYQSPYLISPKFCSLSPSHNPHHPLSYLPNFIIYHYHSSIPIILLTLIIFLSIFKASLYLSSLFSHISTLYHTIFSLIYNPLSY